MTKRRVTPWLVGCCILGAVVVLSRRVGFDWQMFWQQLRYVSWLHISAGLVLIWATYLLRAMRWANLCRSLKQLQARDLIGAQFVGFTAVALVGRLADLVRPYLLARRTGLAMSSQIAVYTMERMFDLGAAALVVASALAFSPRDLENRSGYLRVGFGSFGATLVVAIFAATIRWKGEIVAAFTKRQVTRLAPGLALNVEEKILGFRGGLEAISSLRQFGVALAISLAMWVMIGLSYVQVVRAFAHTPELSILSFPQIMLLLAVSLGGSLLQLPILGWFTQVAVMATALHVFFHVPIEDATACGALMLFVTTLSIIPIGLIFAQIGGIKLGGIANESGNSL